MTDLVLRVLVQRRGALVAEVRRTEETLHRLLADVEHMDATIQQFDGTYKANPPSVSPMGGGGRVTKSLLTVLRKSTEPRTLRDLTIGMMEALGLDHRDKKRVRRLMEQCRVALYRQEGFGVVVREEGPGRALVWRVAR